MPIVTMPNGIQLDIGDNPSEEVKARVREKYQELAKSASTPTTSPPEQSTTTTTTSDTPPPPEPGIVPEGIKKMIPTAVRTIGPVGSGMLAAGAVSALGQPELAPAAYIFGSGVGGAASDIEAQREEIAQGTRAAYNPLKTVTEGVTNTMWAGIPMGGTALKAALKAGTLGVISNTALSVADGEGIPSTGQNAVAFLTAGGLQAGAKYLEIRRSSIKEIAGTDEVASHVETLTGPDAPTHGPDGEPTDVPRVMLYDAFDRPVNKEGVQYQTPNERAKDIRQLELDAHADARRPGIFENTPTKGTPPPIDSPAMPMFEKDGGYDALKESIVKQDLPGNSGYDDPTGMTTNFFKYVGRTKDYFARLEKETHVPVYQDYDALSQANQKWQVAKNEVGAPAVKALKGMDVDDQLSITQALMGSDGAAMSNLSPAKRKIASTVQSVSDRALRPFGLTSNDFWGEFVPAMSSGDTSGLDPDKYMGILKAVEDGRLNVRDPNLARTTSQLVKVGTFEETATPVIDAMKKKYGPEMQGIPAAVREAVNYTASTMTGTPDLVSQRLGVAMQSVFDKLGWNFNGKNFANTAVALPYAALLGWRPAPLIRNAMQTLQTAVGPMGGKWLAEGYRQVMTAEGRQLLEHSGVTANSILEQLDMMGDGNSSKIMDWTISKGMAPFGAVENYINRGPVYLGTRAKVLDAVERAGGNLSKFLELSGVDRYTVQDAKIIKNLWATGNHLDAADRAAQMMVDNTQFMYSALEKPRMLTGSAGKYLGSFGTWPLSYARYLVSLNETGGGAGAYQVGRDIARWTIGNAAVAATFYGLAKFSGDDDALMHTLGWTFLAPAVYSGGPIMSTLKAGADAASSVLSGEPFLGHQKGYVTPRMQDFMRQAGSSFVPMGGIGMDVYKASQETSGRAAAGRITGFKRGAVSKPGGFQPYRAGRAYGQY